MGKEGKFTLINSEGVEVTYDILFTFESEETNKNYIVYTDNSKDENGNVRVFAGTYDPTGTDKKLGEITSDKEWNIISDILSKLEEKVRNGEITADEEGNN